MSLSIILESFGPLELQPAYPAGYQGLVLGGSTPYLGQGAFGWLLIQEVVQEQYRIRYIIVKAFQKTVLHWREERALKMRLALHNELRYLGPKEAIQVHPSHYHLVWAPDKEAIASFGKGKEYRVLSTHFTPSLVEQLLPEFPDHPFSEAGVRPLEPQLNALVQTVLTNPYQDQWRHFFYETKVRELLFSLLTGLQVERRREDFSEEEIRRVHQVDVLILSDLTRHYTIRQLAEKIHLSQDRLKEAFKAVIGVGMYERLKEARLQKARELLLTTNLPSKALYEQVGYESITGFIDAFKGRFGLSPIQYRKLYQPKG